MEINIDEKALLQRRLKMIPTRILDLLLEVDKLKELYKESYERYNEIINMEQKVLMEAMNKVGNKDGS